jgi:hypothetical protein
VHHSAVLAAKLMPKKRDRFVRILCNHGRDSAESTALLVTPPVSPLRKDLCSESLLLDNIVSFRLPLYSRNVAYDTEGLNSAMLSTMLRVCLGLKLVR